MQVGRGKGPNGTNAAAVPESHGVRPSDERLMRRTAVAASGAAPRTAAPTGRASTWGAGSTPGRAAATGGCPRRAQPPPPPTCPLGGGGGCRAPRLARVAGVLGCGGHRPPAGGGGRTLSGRLHLREEHRPLPRRRRLAASLFFSRGRHPARAHHPPRRLDPTSLPHRFRHVGPDLRDETEVVKRPEFFYSSDCAHGGAAATSCCDLCTFLSVRATVCIRFV